MQDQLRVRSAVAEPAGILLGPSLLGQEMSRQILPADVAPYLGVIAQIGVILYLFVVGRALYLAMQTQDTYARLLGGSLALTFFVYVFINAGMVSGLLPVVGVPLPLVSYGGSSMVTRLLAR